MGQRLGKWTWLSVAFPGLCLQAFVTIWITAGAAQRAVQVQVQAQIKYEIKYTHVIYVMEQLLL